MEHFLFRLGLVWVFSTLITLYIVPVVMQIAAKLDVLDIPDGTIKKHDKPIPYLGGIAIYIGFIATLALFFSFEVRIVLLLIGVTLLLFLGLIDDLVRMKAYQKFVGQFIAAFCFLKSGFYLKEAFFLHNLWSIPLSLLWILSVINAFNLVDIMDGLATVLALWATIAFMVCALFLGQTSIALFLTAFAGTLCGFLFYNKPPARIYLGDAGSLYIGGFLATIPFLLPWSYNTPWGYFAPVIVLAIPLLEVFALVVIRTYKRIPFYNASPDHFALYLRAAGWSKMQILCVISSICLGLIIVAGLLLSNILGLFSLSIITTTFLIGWFFLIGYKSYLSHIS